jgi:hypothetical protein
MPQAATGAALETATWATARSATRAKATSCATAMARAVEHGIDTAVNELMSSAAHDATAAAIAGTGWHIHDANRRRVIAGPHNLGPRRILRSGNTARQRATGRLGRVAQLGAAGAGDESTQDRQR